MSGGRPRLVWTPEMVATLRSSRARGLPLYLCAEQVGVAYVTAVLKARELGLAHRMNWGTVPGTEVVR